MITAKLRGLQALAPLTLDGSILRHLSQPSWQSPGNHVFDQNISDKGVLKIPLFKFVTFEVRNAHTFPVHKPTLQLTVWPNDAPTFNRSICSANKSVQTDCPSKSEFNLTAISEKLSVAFHKLNIIECDRFSEQSKTWNSSASKKCPAIWLALGKLDYSPALFNLGVWYERRAAACSSTESTTKLKYQSKAEERYKRAVLIDQHPIAAYNLACLLLRSDRKEIQIGAERQSVIHLMRMAADSGIEPAISFLQK